MVERGDVPSTRQYLNLAKQTGMNLNCLDPLGRTALLVAIENENIEMIELLLSYGVEVGDALLHAINEENVEAVELLLNHELATKGEQQPLTTTVPSSSFTPDITPIILAGHRDNYEIIKILLDRGYRIPKPHNARCSCKDCIIGSQEDSLRHSRSRINAYKALASPSLICLSSKDPILTSFELSCELKQLSKLENEFKADYEKLAGKCQEFAVDLLEQTRGSRELAIILNHDNTMTEEQNCDKVRLSRLKLAIKYKQKKVNKNANKKVTRLEGEIQTLKGQNDEFQGQVSKLTKSLQRLQSSSKDTRDIEYRGISKKNSSKLQTKCKKLRANLKNLIENSNNYRADIQYSAKEIDRLQTEYKRKN
ncbi:hypothetical protein Btru_065902 [Bulinus truncatus]|nr:hypothetical protein Btru_065902 [Bulinus truncatus]